MLRIFLQTQAPSLPVVVAPSVVLAALRERGPHHADHQRRQLGRVLRPRRQRLAERLAPLPLARFEFPTNLGALDARPALGLDGARELLVQLAAVLGPDPRLATNSTDGVLRRLVFIPARRKTTLVGVATSVRGRRSLVLALLRPYGGRRSRSDAAQKWASSRREISTPPRRGPLDDVLAASSEFRGQRHLELRRHSHAIVDAPLGGQPVHNQRRVVGLGLLGRARAAARAGVPVRRRRRRRPCGVRLEEVVAQTRPGHGRERLARGLCGRVVGLPRRRAAGAGFRGALLLRQGEGDHIACADRPRSTTVYDF